MSLPNLQRLLDAHAILLESNPYCYFELAYTRQTEWMVWICSKPREDDPSRKVLAKGQDSTPEEAAGNAYESLGELCTVTDLEQPSSTQDPDRHFHP